MGTGTVSGADGMRLVLTGGQAKACSIAVERFSSLRENPDIRRFHVYIADDSENYQVIFVPNKGKNDPGRGGIASAGREVHYTISKSTFQITRTSFAR